MRQASLKLRWASLADARRLFLWRNHLSARRNSFHRGKVLWSGHLSWFRKKLADPNCCLYILSLGGKAVGQYRLDKDGRFAVVSVGLDEPYQGKGLGAEAIRLGTVRGLRALGLRRAAAFIKAKNTASRRAFEKAGYHFERGISVSGQKALRMVFKA